MKLLLDSFPAKVTLTAREGAPSTDHTFFAVRALVTPTTLIVVADGATGPVEVFRANHDGDPAVLDSPLYTSAVIEKDLSCGCGGRLRSWNPYRFIDA